MYRLVQRRKAGPTHEYPALPALPRPNTVPSCLTVENIVRVEPTTSPLTGLASVGLLTLALEHVYAHCQQRRVLPSEAFALLILETEFSDRSPVARDAVRVMIADEVRRTFTGGETIAEVGNRLVILGAHTSGLRRSAVGLLRRLRRVRVLKDTHLSAQIRPLPDDPGELTRFVLEMGL